MKVYLDNAATTFPKPETVISAIGDFLAHYAANPGRSGHSMSLKAEQEVFETRELLAELFNVPDSERVIFTYNATLALNMAVKGILKKGDHVIITSMEHNSVIRPLRYLEQEQGLNITIVKCDNTGSLRAEQLKNYFRDNTKLVITLHGSNVTGAVLPVRDIGEICKENNVIYLVDAAQTAGILPIDMQNDSINILAFSGHKKLYGPAGIGGLCLDEKTDMLSFVQGGTGSKSESEIHPGFYPDKHEAGTKNTVGIVGLKAAVRYILDKGILNIKAQTEELSKIFIKELMNIKEVTVYGPAADDERIPVVSINIKDMMPSDVAYRLDKEYGIMVRPGLHCAPLAHKTLGTSPEGTVRFGIGCFNTKEEIYYTVDCLKKIIK